MKNSKDSLSEPLQMQLDLFGQTQDVSDSHHDSPVASQVIIIPFREAAEKYAQLRRQEVYKSIAQMAAHLK